MDLQLRKAFRGSYFNGSVSGHWVGIYKKAFLVRWRWRTVSMDQS